MATPEGRVKTQVKKLLDAHKVYQHWPVQTGYGKACLDCHGCHVGRYFAIETKAVGKHPTPRQLITIEEIQEAGGETFIIGESIVHRAGDTLLDRYSGKPYTVHRDIYSGEKELEAWLENGYK